MTRQQPHISVCICTYKRPEYLKRLLSALSDQDTDNLFTYSIVVADNDRLQSAERVVIDFTAASLVPIRYCVEPRQNIPLVRNKAVTNADGDLIAFIDDDEFPIRSWLLLLFRTLKEYKVDGALGPVKPHFDTHPPQWVVKGKFYDRPTYPTGHVIEWKQGRTGNVLLKKQILTADEELFRPEFRTGEDQDFFRRMIEKGSVFVWCNEALAYEVVPPIRWKRTFMLRRALLQGTSSLLHPNFGALDFAKSVVAIPVYAATLPIALVFGQHRCMRCLIKLFSHIGRILGLAGINPVREQYVTE